MKIHPIDKLNKISIGVLLSLFLLIASMVAAPSANALYSTTQIDGMLPNGVKSAAAWDNGCKEFLKANQPVNSTFNTDLRTDINTGASYVYKVWISERNQPVAKNPVPVQAGAKSIPAQLNGVDFLCRTLTRVDLTNGCNNRSISGSQIIQANGWVTDSNANDRLPNPIGGDCMFPARNNTSTNYQSLSIVSNTSSPAKISWNGPTIVNTPRDSESRYWFANRTVNFSLDSQYATGFVKDGTIKVRAQIKEIKSYFGNSVHQCQNSSNAWIGVNGQNDWSRCKTFPVEYSIQIKIMGTNGTNTVPTGQLRAVCRNAASSTQRISYSNVEDLDGATTSYVQGPSGRFIAINSNRSGYKDVVDANGGSLYRLYVKDVGPKGSGTYVQVASARTVECKPPPANQRTVRIKPAVNVTSQDIEPTETATYEGYATVSGFPQINEWGYREKSVQLNAERVQASGRSTLQSQSRQRTGTSTSSYNASCSWYRSDGTCGKYYCPYNNASLSGTRCYYTYNYTYYEYRYKCEYNSSWGAWGGGAPSCMQYWTCPGGATGGNVYRSSAPTCNGWRCQYPSAQINQYSQPTCEARCDGGRGTWTAPLSYGTYYNYGDRNCYIEPYFNISCYWDTGQTTNDTVRYPGNSQYCRTNESAVGEYVGQLLCMEFTAEYPNQWRSVRSPQTPPGYTPSGQTTTWGWTVDPDPASGCARVVGRPLVKVNGGDVAAGGAFVNGICSGSTSSTVAGWPRSPSFDGSGSDYGVFASGSINGFASAQLAAGESSPPRDLAFSNTVTSGADGYGGSFGQMPCIPDYNAVKPSGTLPKLNLNSLHSNINSNAIVSGTYESTVPNNPTLRTPTTLQSGKQITVYATGNVYIADNILYQRGGWTKLSDIPGFKLVVNGNIFISPNVSELNGIYIAQPGSGGGGNIYTCAPGRATVLPDTSLYNSCLTTLKVNGAFIAKKVHLQRTLGTQKLNDHTAETFNLLPEMWLTNWADDQDSEQIKYDSITSLPPVL